MAKKWLIENEPILLRDILPKVMFDIRQQRRYRANADYVKIRRTPAKQKNCKL